jgi:cell division control protein 6
MPACANTLGISNDFQFRDNFSPKVKDTLAEKEILFPLYDANQLISILEPRADKAFHEDILESDVVPLCAAFAAQDSGSARQAIRLLREAGELAQANDDETVTEWHVREAQDELEKNQLYEGMQELTIQGHAVLCALAFHQAMNEVPVRSRTLYKRYMNICEQFDADSVSERRVRDHLSDLSMLASSASTNETRDFQLVAIMNMNLTFRYELSSMFSALRTVSKVLQMPSKPTPKNSDLLK